MDKILFHNSLENFFYENKRFLITEKINEKISQKKTENFFDKAVDNIMSNAFFKIKKKN